MAAKAVTLTGVETHSLNLTNARKGEMIQHMNTDPFNFVTICSHCKRKLGNEDFYMLDQNEGYTGCCNEPTDRVAR